MIRIEVDWGGIWGWINEWAVCSWLGHAFIPYQRTEYCRRCGQWGEIKAD